MWLLAPLALHVALLSGAPAPADAATPPATTQPASPLLVEETDDLELEEVAPEQPASAPAATQVEPKDPYKWRGLAAAGGASAALFVLMDILQLAVASVTFILPVGCAATLLAVSTRSQQVSEFIAPYLCLCLCALACFPAQALAVVGVVGCGWVGQSIVGPCVTSVLAPGAAAVGWGAAALFGNRRIPLVPFLAAVAAPSAAGMLAGCLLQLGGCATLAAVRGGFSAAGQDEIGVVEGVLLFSVCSGILLVPLFTSGIGHMVSAALAAPMARMGRTRAADEPFEPDLFSVPPLAKAAPLEEEPALGEDDDAALQGQPAF